MQYNNCTKEVKDNFLQIVQNFCKDVSRKLEKCNRHWNRVLQENESWLSKDVIFPEHKYSLTDSKPSDVDIGSNGKTKIGRAAKSFDDLCERSKIRRVIGLRESSGSELAYAASMNLRVEGNT